MGTMGIMRLFASPSRANRLRAFAPKKGASVLRHRNNSIHHVGRLPELYKNGLMIEKTVALPTILGYSLPCYGPSRLLLLVAGLVVVQLMYTSIRVLLIDDHRLLVQALQRVLDAQPDIKVVGSANSADEAIEKTRELCPDIAIMDIDMPGLLCFDAAHSMVALSPQTKIVYLSGFSSDRYIEAALGAHAHGYITKNEPVEAILEALRTVAAGSAYFSPSILSRIVFDDKPRLEASSSSRRSLLSPREVEIVQYLARGLSKKQIAQTMHLAVRTVDNHTTRVMRKLDIHDRVQLARYAIKEGIASL